MLPTNKRGTLVNLATGTYQERDNGDGARLEQPETVERLGRWWVVAAGGYNFKTDVYGANRPGSEHPGFYGKCVGRRGSRQTEGGN